MPARRDNLAYTTPNYLFLDFIHPFSETRLRGCFMTLRELQIHVLDEIDTIINEPVINPQEVRERVQEAFRQYEKEQTDEAAVL